MGSSRKSVFCVTLKNIQELRHKQTLSIYSNNFSPISNIPK